MIEINLVPLIKTYLHLVNPGKNNLPDKWLNFPAGKLPHRYPALVYDTNESTNELFIIISYIISDLLINLVSSIIQEDMKMTSAIPFLFYSLQNP